MGEMHKLWRVAMCGVFLFVWYGSNDVKEVMKEEYLYLVQKKEKKKKKKKEKIKEFNEHSY